MGEVIEIEGQFVGGDLDQMIKQREILTFAFEHDFIDPGRIEAFLDAPIEDQTDEANELLKAFLLKLSEAAPHYEAVLSVTTPENINHSDDDAYGLFIAPYEVRSFYRIESPDPLLENWLIDFKRACADVLEWAEVDALLEREWECALEHFAEATTECVKTNYKALRAALETEDTDELQRIMGESDDPTYPDYVLSSAADILDLYASMDWNPKKPKRLKKLLSELDTLCDKWPRFEYEPLIKQIRSVYPDLLEAEQVLRKHKGVLRHGGDYIQGESFIVVTKEVEPACETLIDQQTNFMWENGEIGFLSLDLTRKNALKTLLAHCKFASKFTSLCDHY